MRFSRKARPNSEHLYLVSRGLLVSDAKQSELAVIIRFVNQSLANRNYENCQVLPHRCTDEGIEFWVRSRAPKVAHAVLDEFQKAIEQRIKER